MFHCKRRSSSILSQGSLFANRNYLTPLLPHRRRLAIRHHHLRKVLAQVLLMPAARRCLNRRIILLPPRLLLPIALAPRSHHRHIKPTIRRLLLLKVVTVDDIVGRHGRLAEVVGEDDCGVQVLDLLDVGCVGDGGLGSYEICGICLIVSIVQVNIPRCKI